ncbi:imidazole glycerol phosphate synthase subunit HisH [Niveibacterium umoris]|uniref:Imidazole glycerol phosphate synthase subunit HisH n=1 Tax=Niveibacterium umoris TaxID=1193620 RepID=A0A840BHM7_9RHOO|nr:imidazole glycerol phosphate synthase subunit HisH [Niveibacterium umoris]MBB4012735.1 glutamine amidotransferase [Niveibacterium umoris]
MKIAVVDYGMGNLRSVAKALEHVAPEATVVVTSEASELDAADRVVVPGQGALHDCMREFLARGLRDSVERASRTKPFLGICVGMQMLFDHGDEGDTAGLGLVAGEVPKFSATMQSEDGAHLKVPHMGWNEVEALYPHPMFAGIAPNARFYFVHSYYCAPRDVADAVAQTRYGIAFTSAVARDNIFATQFHPEKSAAAGLQLLANFVSWMP